MHCGCFGKSKEEHQAPPASAPIKAPKKGTDAAPATAADSKAASTEDIKVVISSPTVPKDENWTSLEQRQKAIMEQLAALEQRIAQIGLIVPDGSSTVAAAAFASPLPSGLQINADGKADKAKAKAAKGAAKSPPSSSPPAVAEPSFPIAADDPNDRWWDRSTFQSDNSAVAQRLGTLAVSMGIHKYRFYRVAKDYYGWALPDRQAVLGLPSTAHLCKSVVMSNTHAEPKEVNEGNPQVILVIVSYTEKLHREKLGRAVWAHHVAWENAQPEDKRRPGGPLPKKAFNLRLADDADAIKLTGYDHNAMVPIGMPAQLPIFMSHTICGLSGGSFALGGGEVDLKWRINTSEFVDAYKKHGTLHIADITTS
jgi:hypothetical protein